jgi:hypothetical protein
MELRKNGRDSCALPQELPGIALQPRQEIINRAINVFEIPPTMALDIFRVRAIEADMHAVPSAMTTPRTSRTTLVDIQMLAFLIGCHGFISFSRVDARPAVVHNPEFLYEFFVSCLPIEDLEFWRFVIPTRSHPGFPHAGVVGRHPLAWATTDSSAREYE